jgi:hypothetical protein
MSRLFLIIAVVMMLAAIACIYLIVPDSAWSATALVSAAILVVASGAWVFLPGLGGRDTQLALLGPSGVLGIALLTSAAISLWAAVVGNVTTAAVMNVLNVAGLAIGYLVLRVASRMIARTVDEAVRSEGRRELYAKVKKIGIAIDDDSLSREVRTLAEDIAHTPDSAFESRPQDIARLTELTDGLAAAVSGKDIHRTTAALTELKAAVARAGIDLASRKI